MVENIEIAVAKRHSVRNFLDEKISKSVADELNEFIIEQNVQSGLNIQLILNEPEAFNGNKTNYGSFSNVKNYICMVGKGKNLDERIGYFGEKIVLKAQMLGLNTCWVAISYRKRKAAYKTNKGEKLIVVVALGYGKTQGIQHKNKDLYKVAKDYDVAPNWFKRGVDFAMLAPTAMNQQAFTVKFVGGKAEIVKKHGFYSSLDLGIVKCHFEIGAGENNYFSFDK